MTEQTIPWMLLFSTYGSQVNRRLLFTLLLFGGTWRLWKSNEIFRLILRLLFIGPPYVLVVLIATIIDKFSSFLVWTLSFSCQFLFVICGWYLQFLYGQIWIQISTCPFFYCCLRSIFVFKMKMVVLMFWLYFSCLNLKSHLQQEIISFLKKKRNYRTLICSGLTRMVALIWRSLSWVITVLLINFGFSVLVVSKMCGWTTFLS